MSLVDLWKTDRSQIETKRLWQSIHFAGEGQLRDGNATSKELRELLSVVPSEYLGEWIDQCLEDKFPDFGFVFQDIINEIGKRLGFEVTPGVYRGQGNGFDGVWRIPDGNVIVIESKSTTTYSITLSQVVGYRDFIAREWGCRLEDISILLVIGREDTEDLEAQVRGSKYAWSIRLLGIDSLFRLLKLKETLDDPNVERQIKEILVPQEFTRLDRIIDLVFATAEEVGSADAEVEDDEDAPEPVAPKIMANFHQDVIPRLETQFKVSLVKKARVLWATPANDLLLSCQVSKERQDSRADALYWFGLKRGTKESLEAHNHSYLAFGLGSPRQVLVVPYSVLARYIPGCFTSPEPDGKVRHWHLRFAKTGQTIELLVERDRHRLDLTQYLLPRDAST